MDVKAFYDEVKNPPASLLADYPWLTAVLPKGASLEGFLGAATYTVPPDITADEFVRMLLDAWYQQVGPDLLNVPAARGLTFYQVAVAGFDRRAGDRQRRRPGEDRRGLPEPVDDRITRRPASSSPTRRSST